MHRWGPGGAGGGYLGPRARRAISIARASERVQGRGLLFRVRVLLENQGGVQVEVWLWLWLWGVRRVEAGCGLRMWRLVARLHGPMAPECETERAGTAGYRTRRWRYLRFTLYLVLVYSSRLGRC